MLKLFRYKLPFKQPFKTGRGEYFFREGILLSYKKGDEYQLSEASPLPGFSPDTLYDVQKALIRSAGSINTFLLSDFDNPSLRDFLDTLPPFPSLQFAISYLGLRLLLSRNNLGISDFFNRPGQKSLLINDVVGVGSKDLTIKSIKSSAEKGFTTIKLKSDRSPGDLPEILKKASEEFPQVSFRLDANRSWPIDSLKSYSSQFQNIPIEYIEEPCKIDHIHQIEFLITQSELPVAFDESITSFAVLDRVLKRFPNNHIVIKPSLYGNIFDLAETIYRHRSLGIRIVVSTLLESAIGRIMNAHVALAIGDPSLAHGLNTGHFFKKDIIDGRSVSDGTLSFSVEDFTPKKNQVNAKLLKPLK